MENKTIQRQERPSLAAIIADDGLDAMVVFCVSLIISLPFFGLSSLIGIAFVFLGIIGAALFLFRMLFDFLEREYTLYTLESDRLVIVRGI